jgi:hypothetical protein
LIEADVAVEKAGTLLVQTETCTRVPQAAKEVQRSGPEEDHSKLVL